MTYNSRGFVAEPVPARIDPEVFNPDFDPVLKVIDDAPFNIKDLIPFVMEEQMMKDIAIDSIQAKLSRSILENYNKFIDGMKFVQEVDLDISRAEIAVGNILRKMRSVRSGFVSDALKTLRRRRRRDRLMDLRARAATLKSAVDVEKEVKASFASREYCKCIDLIVHCQRLLSSPRLEAYAVLEPLKHRMHAALFTLRDQLHSELLAAVGTAPFSPAHYAAILRGLHGLDKEGILDAPPPPPLQQLQSSSSTAIAASGGGASGAPAPLALPGGSGMASVGGSPAFRDVACSDAGADALLLPCSPMEGNIPSIATKVKHAVLAAMKNRTKAAIVLLIIRLEDEHVIEMTPASAHAIKAATFTTAAAAASPFSATSPSSVSAASSTSTASATSATAAASVPALGASGAVGGAGSGGPLPPVVPPAVIHASRTEGLLQVRFPELCRLIPDTHLVEATACVCQALLNVLHTHYLIMQWHRCPLDPRNDDPAFLRRCGVDCPDAPGDRRCPESPEDAELYSVLLTGVRRDMLETRRSIWEAMQQRLWQLLFNVVEPAGASLQFEYLTGAFAVANKLLEYGCEYSHSDASQLHSSVKYVLDQVMDKVTIESTDTLHKSLAKEMWERVPISLDALKDVLLNLTGSVLSLSPELMAGANNVISGSGGGGGAGGEGDGDDGTGTPLGEDGGSSGASTPVAAQRSSGPKVLPQLMDVGSVFDKAAADVSFEIRRARAVQSLYVDEPGDDAEGDSGAAEATPDRSPAVVEDGNDSPFVVTTTALNVVVKLAGKHFTLMQAFPSLAPTAFFGLTKLFDVYFYTVACAFLPPLALHAVFAHFEALEMGNTPNAAASEDPEAFPFKDPIGVAAAAAAQREYGPGDLSDNKRKSKAANARERVSLAKRVLQQAGGGAGDSDGASDDRQASAPYKMLYSTLRQVRMSYESMRGSAAPPATPIDIPGLGTATVPRPVIATQYLPALESEPTNAGLIYRCIAVESTGFVEHVLKLLYPVLESRVLPPHFHPSLRAFFNRMAASITELRGLLYWSSVPRILPEGAVFPAWVAAVKWDAFKEFVQQNGYVKQICDPLTRAARFLEGLTQRGVLPMSCRVGLWACVVAHVMFRYVEGVSRVKKCSMSGRGVMIGDISAVFSHITTVARLKSGVLVRDKAYVDDFARAFYYDAEPDVMHWIATNRERYLSRHLKALIANGIGPSLKKKHLQELLASVDAMATFVL